MEQGNQEDSNERIIRLRQCHDAINSVGSP